MSLRITQGLLYDRALADIQRGLAGSLRLQGQISSGLRIRRPSDDPGAALRILPLTNDVHDLDRMLGHGQLARELTDLATGSLEDASNLLQRARELTVQAANGTLAESDRRSIAGELDQLLDSLVGIANTQRGGRYVFAGTATDSPPFARVETAAGTRVVYSGTSGNRTVQVAPGVTSELRLAGDAIFQSPRDGRTVTIGGGNTGIRSGAATSTGIGTDTLEVRFAGLDLGGVTGLVQGPDATTALGAIAYEFTAPDQLRLNGGPSVTVSAAGDVVVPVGNDPDAPTVSLSVTSLPITPATGSFTSQATLSLDGGATTTLVDFASSGDVRVVDSGDGAVLDLDVASLTRIGDEHVEFGGSFDVFSTLVAVRDALRNDAGEPAATIAARASGLLDEVDGAHDQVLDALRELGFRSENLTLLESRVTALRDAGTASLSELRDTDVVDALVAFQRVNASYEAALRVSAQVVQTSLLNFLG